MTPAGDAPVLPFNQMLEQVCVQRDSNLCVGLDPDCSRVAKLTGHPQVGSTDLCVNAMFTAAAAAASYCAAFKPNAAFFEALETAQPLMEKVGGYLAENHHEVIAVCDAKRGDIGNTSEHYARAAFDRQKFDCITVNPLMGWDSVEPFVRRPERGVFLLCLTSNPGADDFLLQNELYLRIAEKAVAWNTNDNIGLVVGATRPEYLARIREIAPTLPLLIPGVGAQGGKLDETLDAIDGKRNRRFLINASRSVLYPEGATWETYPQRVADAASQLRGEISALLG